MKGGKNGYRMRKDLQYPNKIMVGYGKSVIKFKIYFSYQLDQAEFPVIYGT